MDVLLRIWIVLFPVALLVFAYQLWGDDWKARILSWRQARVLNSLKSDGVKRPYPMRWNQRLK